MSAESPTDVGVTMLLCDAAQSVGGKLYILGGGWSHATPPRGQPVPMALAVIISIPWDQANHRFPVRVYLASENGEPVDVGEGPIEARTGLEVGRPPGLQAGTSLDASLAISAGTLPILPGRYVWVLELDGVPRARTPFQVSYR